MIKITFDDYMKAKLNGLNEHLEICDETGQTVGHFLPNEMYERLIYDWVNAQVSDEELEQARQEPGGRGLDEIWKSLGRK
jgi:hypothetical protein